METALPLSVKNENPFQDTGEPGIGAGRRGDAAAEAAARPDLLAYGEAVLATLACQMAGTPGVVALADHGGRILALGGAGPFARQAAAAGLRVAADWSEEERGTNAIGTCLAEGRSLAVVGEEHCRADCHDLAAVATPIFGPLSPAGACRPLGVLALFCPLVLPLAHARALLEVHAGFIEDRLIDAGPPGQELRVHPAAEAVDSPLGGRLVFADDGRLLARNGCCGPWLPPALAAGGDFAAGFATPWREVAAGESAIRLLETTDGRRLYARLRPRQAIVPALVKSSAGSLADLGSDDPRIAEAVRRAGRIVECDIPLLIQGETGSGKEWFAQAFHRSGSRRDGPFVAVNCAAIPATLIEAELFGYGEGAFTGARRYGARGKIREADGGTLFLDEIGDMPLALQAVLLRVLETRRVTPLGNDSDEAVDIRLVCASHQPLRDLVGQGSFRADLFFRLSGMTIALPPLRERADFAAVVRRILAEESPGQPIRVDAEAFVLLRRYDWPGNLRQLRNVLRLCVALLGGEGVLQPAHLPAEVRAAHGAAAGLRAVQVRLARESVDRHGGNISAAARELGITRTTLYRLLGNEGRGRRALS